MSFSLINPLFKGIGIFKPHGLAGCSRANIIAAITARDPDSSSSDGVSRAVILDELNYQLRLKYSHADTAISGSMLDMQLKGAVKYGKLIKTGGAFKVVVVTAEERARQKLANQGPFVTKGQSMFASTKNISAYSPVCEKDGRQRY